MEFGSRIPDITDDNEMEDLDQFFALAAPIHFEPQQILLREAIFQQVGSEIKDIGIMMLNIGRFSDRRTSI